jgi:beta-lactamase class A
MRERNRFSKQNRAGRSKSAGDARRGENRSTRGNRKDAGRREKAANGGLFGLFGNSSGRRNRASANPGRRPGDQSWDRLVELKRPRAQRGAAVVSLNRFSERRRQAATRPEKPMIQLPSPRTKPGRFLLYGARLAIFGIGLGVLAGTMLSIWDPASTMTAEQKNGKAPAAEVRAASNSGTQLTLGQELVPLKNQIATLTAQQKQLKAGVLLLDLDTNAYVDINANEVFPAASTIKFPILVAFFQDVDAGKIQWNEPLTMKKELVATEAGDMQYQPVGTQFSAIETATKMMVVSDNTATNMLIDRLGGMASLNQRFQSWGIGQTKVAALLPDVQGSNATTPKDLANLMSQVQSGKLVSMKSRDQLLKIMQSIENDTLLPKGLGAGSTIAHKTGTLSGLIGDIGLIDTPTGKRYLASVLVQRQKDDVKAEELIQQISRMAYQAISQPNNSSLQRPKIATPN